MDEKFILRYRSHLALFVIIISFLTFFVPKEIFDNHIGIRNDIFCKSLDSVNDRIETFIVIAHEFIKSTNYFYFNSVLITLFITNYIPIRAPPTTS